ncbi:MAG: hypothetical protein WBC70_03050, partial [Candidatus Aminicenantales bacterium]
AELLSYLGRIEEALKENNIARNLDPLAPRISANTGWYLYFARRYEEALQCYRRAIELGGISKDPEADMASCYALMGKREEALKILDGLIEYSKTNFVSSVSMAFAYAALGENELLFARLEKAVGERDPYLLGLKHYHRFDGVRADPRFTDLLRRIGLEK